MRVLVTGGSGFIGGYTVDALRARGLQPVIFDRRGKPRTDAEVIMGDVRDFTAVMEAVAVCDGVIHLAGVLGTQETVDEPQPAIETNVIGSMNVFKAIRHYKRRGVYIAVGNHWMNNSYSITKTTAERFALMANKEWGTEIAVVRALNAYGPKQKAEPVRKIMPNFVIPALRGEAITLYGDGSQVMDMIYVADVAEILVRALGMSHGVYDRPFEAGTGRRTTVNEIAEMVIAQAGDGYVQFHPMRPGEEPGSVVLGNPNTLKPLGITAEQLIPLEEGIARTVKHYAADLALHPSMQ